MKTKKESKFAVEVITNDQLTTRGPLPAATGWGEKAEAFLVQGDVRSITIMSEGKAMVGLRINGDGDITITSYRASFETYVPQNLHLRARRNWRKEKQSQPNPRRCTRLN